MKKAISLLLSLVIMSSMFAAFGQTFVSAAEATNYDKETEVLKYIGVLSGSVNYDEKISRAQFADYVARFYGKTQFDENRYFKDVPSDYWASGSINYLAEIGLISVGEDRMFYPERIISLSEACKIMLYASGYEVLADYSGGFAKGVMNLAYSNDIIPSGIVNANELTVGEAIKIIFNGITIPAYEKLGLEYDINKDDTLLRKYYDIFIAEGVITAVHGASYTDILPLERNEVCIDYEKCFLEENVNPEDKFLDYVEYVYRLDDNDEKYVIYTQRIEKKNDDLVIESDEIENFSQETYTLTYCKENTTKSKTQSFERGIKIIYNGSVYEGSVLKIFDDFINKKARGTIKFKSLDGGNYDTLVVKSYRSIVIGYINSELTAFSNKYDVTDSIDTDEYEFVRICDKNGTAANLTSKIPQVVSVSESENKKYIEIVPCQQTASGKIEAISDDYVTIAGEEYPIDPVLEKNISIIIGHESSAAIDEFGYIVMLTTNKDGYNIGYLTKITYDPEEYKLIFKIFGTDGNINTYNAAEKITIDEQRYKSEDIKRVLMAIPDKTGIPGTYYSEVEEGYQIKAARQVIRYKLNASSEITALDTIYCSSEENPENTLQRDLDGSTGMFYYHGPRSFGMNTAWNKGKTITFSVPPVNDNGMIEAEGRYLKDDVSLYSANSSFDHDQWYTVESYYFDPDNVFADVLVRREVAVVDEFRTFIVDSKKTEWIESTDEVAHILTGYMCGSHTTYTADTDLDVSGLKCGDVLKIKTNTAGTEIISFTKIFDIEAKAFANQTGTSRYWYDIGTYGEIPAYNYFRSAAYNLVKGYVAQKDAGNFIKLSYELGQDEGMTLYGAYPVIIYDEENGKLKVGSTADLKDYKQHRSNCSHILLSSRKSTIDYIYIFE